MRSLSLPVIAALLFGICDGIAAASLHFTLIEFAKESGVNRWVFVVVPGLSAALFALFVYQGAEKQVKTVGQSLSRGLLVALLSWFGVSMLATAVWFPIEDFFRWLSTVLLLSGVIGGGPILLAAMCAGAIVGVVIKRRRASWTLKA